MSKYTFNLPDIGEGIAEAEIVKWHVKVGDVVAEDDQLADVMTDKATVEMEAPVSGTITALAGEEGDIIAIGSMLVEIEVDGEVDVDKLEDLEASATLPMLLNRRSVKPWRQIILLKIKIKIQKFQTRPAPKKEF